MLLAYTPISAFILHYIIFLYTAEWGTFLHTDLCWYSFKLKGFVIDINVKC